ncbi:MAG: S-layer homology domain-containing protein, partial [Clostridiales Family XIII bacterium]|nr:S-layer homology domain-containing protein [Clostridiales Family XIII bacterium]
MRKLIMTVLTLALILGCISVASAAPGDPRLTDVADNANEEAIQVAYDLGIVTGTPEGAYEPEKAVNRAEFAALIVRALAVPDSALASYTNSTFKDTSGYSWAVPYLAILQQRGIMKGDGYGNAMPGRTITPNEAVTMVLRAIGYTDNASVLVGQWPANYVALGQNQVLYDKVANDVQMNKASAAQMIYNALTKQLVQVDANSLVTLLYDPGVNGTQIPRTLLTTGLDCSSQGLNVVTYGDAASSKIDLIPKVGAYGILYRTNTGNREVVALTEVETVFLAGKFTYTGAGVLDKFKAVDGTVYNLDSDVMDDVRFLGNMANGANREVRRVFLNGQDEGSATTQSAIQPYVTKFYGTTADENDAMLVIAAKVSGVTILDLRSVAVWDAKYLPGRSDTFLYESGQIDGKKFNGHDFPLDVNNEVDHYGYNIVGVNSIDEIAANNVIYIYKDNDKKIRRIEVGTETQSGVVTNVAATTRTIGGKVLDLAPYSGNDRDKTETPGNEGTALLDVYGRIYDFQLGEASKGNFAVLVAEDTFYNQPQVKIFDKTGNEVIYGTNTDFAVSGANAGIVYKTTSTVLNAHLFRYTLSGGKLSSVVAPLDNHLGDPVLSSGNYGKVSKSGTILTVNGVNSGIIIDSSVIVYTDDGRGNYALASIKDLLDVELTQPFRYITDDKGKLMALLVSSVDAGAQNVFVMVNTLSQGWVTDRVDVVKGLAQGTSTAAEWNFTDDTLTNRLTGGSNYGTFADKTMIKFRMGEDGVLKDFVRLDSNDAYNTDRIGGLTGDEKNPTVVGASFEAYTRGGGGTFTLTVSPSAVAIGAVPAGTSPYYQAGSNMTGVVPDKIT